ncbi:cysteine hydrolase [Candidatus Gottesmanbacteria bacterium]|nr:cysteine hydrolase [Candidatus Gottesmanbacteria bacterium]
MSLKYNSQFLDWLAEWKNSLPSIVLSKLLINPDRTALVSIDMVNGFCHQGSLASEKVKFIIPEVVTLMKKLNNSGVTRFLLFQDTHDVKAEEFKAYPPHCIKSSAESQTIPEFLNLPFADKFEVFEKNSVSPFQYTQFSVWLAKNKQIDTFIIVGNCTDICIYQAVLELKTEANSQNIARRIIIPENCVATFETSLDTARKIGAMPHDSTLLHDIFLYSMRLNGAEVVKLIY